MPTDPPDQAGDDAVPTSRFLVVWAGLVPATATSPVPRMVHQ